MTKAILFIIAIMFNANIALATENCFLAKENDKIVKQIGKCDQSYSPFSTFKIPLAVMGFDSGILNSPTTPAVKFTPEIDQNYVTYYDPVKYPTMLLWKRTQTPQSWMRDSVVWYSRYMTHKLGAKKFEEYVKKFNYGNMDVTGAAGKNDGLMNSWLASSLKISPIEQIEFIEKLASKTLPASKSAQEQTISLIKAESYLDNWQIYGKTGSSKAFGWFAGFVEKEGKRIIFAQMITQVEDSLLSGGKVAKELAKDNLISILLKYSQ
jgi:beta-lactamase class D